MINFKKLFNFTKKNDHRSLDYKKPSSETLELEPARSETVKQLEHNYEEQRKHDIHSENMIDRQTNREARRFGLWCVARHFEKTKNHRW